MEPNTPTIDPPSAVFPRQAWVISTTDLSDLLGTR